MEGAGEGNSETPDADALEMSSKGGGVWCPGTGPSGTWEDEGSPPHPQ